MLFTGVALRTPRAVLLSEYRHRLRREWTPMNHRITRCMAAVALMVTARAQPTFADRFTCFVIGPGETASSLALRLTGDAAHRHQPWFQIVDPAASRFIPKAEYRRIFPGWHVCVAEGRITSELRRMQERPQEVASPVQPASADVAGTLALGRFTVVWSGVALLLAALVVWRTATSYSNGRRTVRTIMTAFGERFVREFERPLMRRSSNDRALESRLRFKPRQRRLDILLAPHGRRRYPNLSDHRMNVEYDVRRVLQRLRDERFVNERLFARGRWVIVRCRMRPDPETRGGE
jgi:hypothetical protein